MIIVSRTIVPLLLSTTPFDLSSFAPIWCLIYLAQVATVAITICFYTLKEIILVTMYIQLSLLYDKVAYDIRHLCAKEHFHMAEEYEQLKRSVKEAQELDE